MTFKVRVLRGVDWQSRRGLTFSGIQQWAEQCNVRWRQPVYVGVVFVCSEWWFTGGSGWCRENVSFNRHRGSPCHGDKVDNHWNTQGFTIHPVLDCENMLVYCCIESIDCWAVSSCQSVLRTSFGVCKHIWGVTVFSSSWMSALTTEFRACCQFSSKNWTKRAKLLWRNWKTVETSNLRFALEKIYFVT